MNADGYSASAFIHPHLRLSAFSSDEVGQWECQRMSTSATDAVAEPAPGLGLERGPAGAGFGPKRILVPLDLLPAGEAKLPVAEEQARAFGATLILLHVLPDRAAGFEGNVTPEESRARAYLDSIALRMRSEGIDA